MDNLIVRVMNQADWQTYKELRLRSLKDSPDAFGGTYQETLEFPDQEWISRLDKNDRAKHAIPLLAIHSSKPIGLAWGLIDPGDMKTAHVYQMWIEPESRGLGAGRLLLEEIVHWAIERGLVSLKLGVTTTNEAAVHLYKTAGFIPYGELEPLRPGSNIKAQKMQLNLE